MQPLYRTCVILILVTLAFSQSGTSGPETGTGSAIAAQVAPEPKRMQPEIVALQTQLVQVLRDRLTFVEARFTEGSPRESSRKLFESVILAHRELLAAELEMASAPSERIPLLEATVEKCREFERVQQNLHDLGVLSKEELLAAKAHLLRAEIELLREQKP